MSRKLRPMSSYNHDIWTIKKVRGEWKAVKADIASTPFSQCFAGRDYAEQAAASANTRRAA